MALFDASSSCSNPFTDDLLKASFKDSEKRYGTFDQRLHNIAQKQPFIEARIDPLTQKYYEFATAPVHLCHPADTYRARCRTLHQFMRIAYFADDLTLVAMLEPHRESALAQLSFAMFSDHAFGSSESYK